MTAIRKPLSHDITLPEQEAYAGENYWRPDDKSVQAAVRSLIDRHSDEFQELIEAEEEGRRENERAERRIYAAEYMMGGR